MRRLLAFLGRIGADATDDDETRRRKALLVGVAVLILPISLVWGVLYLVLGAPSGVAAFAYMAVSIASIGLFAATRDFGLLLRIQLLDITLAPTLSMWPTAGFLASGAVGLWGILGPLGALVFSSVGSSVRWFALFAVAFLASGIAGELAGVPRCCRGGSARRCWPSMSSLVARSSSPCWRSSRGSGGTRRPAWRHCSSTSCRPPSSTG